MKKIFKYLRIISIIVIFSLLFNWSLPALSASTPLPNDFRIEYNDPDYKYASGPIPIETMLTYGGILLVIFLVYLQLIRPAPKKPKSPERKPITTTDFKYEREFLGYEYDRRITGSSFQLSVTNKTTKEGKAIFSVHLDQTKEITEYKKEMQLVRKFKVWHTDGKETSRELVKVSTEENTGKPPTVRKEKGETVPATDVQIEVLTDMNLLKPGIAPKTDVNGNTQIPIYSAKPFLEIEGTRSEDYGLTPNTAFLSKEKFRDYQKALVTFRYKDTRVTEEINCYSLEKSVKDFIGSAINTNISSVRFVVEDIDSHAPISNPNMKIEGTPPIEEELLAPYFTEEYNAYATKFVKSYLRESHEMTSYGTVVLYYPFSYVVEVVHPDYYFWEKKIYIDGSKDEYIIRISELGTKIRTELL